MLKQKQKTILQSAVCPKISPKKSYHNYWTCT
jgi:hypothetical protein